MRFGSFIAPYHANELNPTRLIQRDFELVEWLDDLGYDEAWVGEHHSGGYEMIASPEVFIAAAAERTKRIKLGTGVSSLAYHHPLILADRMVQLDHQTRGRTMMGVGPGQLPTDAFMMGIDPMNQRRMMGESLDAIVRLVRGEVVTMATDWFTLNDARLQMRPFTPGGFEIAVASVSSPSGATMAGRHGLSMLSLAATEPTGFTALDTNWAVAERVAAEHGQRVSRDSWRVVASMHLSETREKAWAEASYGVGDLLRYMEGMGGRALPYASSADAALEAWTTTGIPNFGVATIGTPDDAVATIDRLLARTGGFGTFLLFATDVANRAATRNSLELFADYVIPHYTGANEARHASIAWAGQNSAEFFGAMIQANLAAIKSFEEQR